MASLGQVHGGAWRLDVRRDRRGPGRQWPREAHRRREAPQRVGPPLDHRSAVDLAGARRRRAAVTRRVVVTGLGAVTPLGLDVATTWDGLVHGRSGIGRITRFDPSPYETQIAGEIKGFDPAKYMDRKEIRRTDRFTQYAVAAAAQALEDASLKGGGPDRDRIGVAIATGVGGIETLIDQVLLMKERGPSRLSPFLVPMLMANAGSAQISMQFDVRGRRESARNENGARPGRYEAVRYRLHQRAWHLDAAERPRRDRGDQARVRGPRLQAHGLFDEVDDRASSRRGRRARGHGLRAR